ncbi:5-amino-6-uracil reductase [Scheffersomyces amazonensis]|uniref:5-amino-6-uracil reductase n=1 Tax=Scheffersomyces amazonensis TaxID=1078765 RepID=UPI00315DFBBD
MSLIPLPDSLRPFLHDYLPTQLPDRTFVTLTYAQSLDSKIAAQPGHQTKISHLETKTMTHYLRSKHDAILVGIGTVLADDPKLNCRFKESTSNSISSPRPIILDPHGKWNYRSSQLFTICEAQQGLAPYIIIDTSVNPTLHDIAILQNQGGKFIKRPLIHTSRSDSWKIILSTLYEHGLKSVMIEGGAKIINDLLSLQKSDDLINSLIITIGPVFLGYQGVSVHPHTNVNLNQIKWWSGVQDSIVCARVSTE